MWTDILLEQTYWIQHAEKGFKSKVAMDSKRQPAVFPTKANLTQLKRQGTGQGRTGCWKNYWK